jgi:S1-C subfamily serine protease
MKRPKLICLLVATFLLSFVLTAFFGDWFVERVALLPLVRKYEIVKPRTPLVINTREEVRISDTSDLVAIANKSKDRLAALTEEASGVVRLRGNLVAISSDGWYLASKQSFGSKDPKGLFVKTENGTEAVDQLVFDDFTDIVLVKTKLLSRAVMSIAPSRDFTAGDRVALLAILENTKIYALSSVLGSEEYLPFGEFQSESPVRVALLQKTDGLVPGQAVVNIKGDMVGLWVGDHMVSASIVQEAITKFFSQQNLARPYFGFSYQRVLETNSTPLGLKVVSVAPLSPAKFAGLQVGDIILKINDLEVKDSAIADSLLTSLVPDKSYAFQVARGSNQLTLSLKPTKAQVK